jgi:hypothetical protein
MFHLLQRSDLPCDLLVLAYWIGLKRVWVVVDQPKQFEQVSQSVSYSTVNN